MGKREITFSSFRVLGTLQVDACGLCNIRLIQFFGFVVGTFYRGFFFFSETVFFTPVPFSRAGQEDTNSGVQHIVNVIVKKVCEASFRIAGKRT